MTTTLDIINISPSTKDEAELFAQKLTEEVEAGAENPLRLTVKLNAMGKAIETVKKNILEYALNEAEKYEGKKFDAYGAEVSISELGTKYSFEGCNDPVWNEANEQMKKWEEKKKEREKFLKTITTSMDVIIEGEALTLNAPIKTSTTGLKITLK